MKNLEVAKIFENIANILEIKGANPFRIRAYQNAAQTIENLTSDLEELAQKGTLTKLPGIGEDLAKKIEEILKTGTSKDYKKLKKEIPSGLLDILEIPGLGPKTVKLLYEKLNIKNISSLKNKAKKGKLIGLPGIQEKTVENILRGIAFLEKGAERMPLHIADRAAREVISELKKLKEIKDIDACGSLRRMKETVRDIDILLYSPKPQAVMNKVTSLSQVKEIISKGETKSSILTKDNVQVDIRVVKKKSYGAALLYFTGSKPHNIKLRQMAQRKKWKINEYGIFRGKKQIAGKTEDQMYRKLKLPFMPPEIREDTGEIELGLKNKLPKLIGYNDIKGDLHVHSKASDGSYSIEEMAQEAKKRGYEYIAITDHSISLKVAGGLSLKKLSKQIKDIQKINKRLKGITILSGTEIDIKDDGSLDYPDSILKEVDVIICAIHSGFKQPKEKLTKRIIKAMQNKYTTIVAHPSGRLMGTREPYELDYDEIFKAAKETNTFLEINAYPLRLDLMDIWVKEAKEKRVKMVISTDAHTFDHYDYMRYGIATARRGWLEKKDVLNTLPFNKLKEKIKR